MSGRPGASAGLLGLTLVLTALNLRAAVTSVGALLRDIQFDLGMSDTVAGVLTTLPVIAFGAFGLLAARLSRRMGTSRALVAALGMVTVGLAVRAVAPGIGTLLVTTLLTLIGIAVGNVLVPVAVKAWFPDRVGRVTGLYSTAVLLGTAIPAAVSVPIADAFGGWRFGLGAWALPAGLALVPWIVVWRRNALARADEARLRAAGPDLVVDHEAEAVRGEEERERIRRIVSAVRRSPKSWALMTYFGIQSLEAYSMMGWLSAIFQDAGVGAGRAGVLVAVTTGLSAPIALVVPMIAARRPDQRAWVVVFALAAGAGYLGLLLAPARAPLLWAVFLGVGLTAFPLALLLIGLRATTGHGTSALSSLTQGFGYLLAATGPVVIGFAHDVTGGWNVPLAILLVLLVPKLIAGLMAGRPGAVDAEAVD